MVKMARNALIICFAPCVFSAVLAQAPPAVPALPDTSPGNMEDINFQQNWPIDLARNKLIAELPYIGKQYKISFEVLISKFEFSEDYLNIIHFTLGQNAGVYGDRVPAVWLYKDKLFHISSAVNGNLNYAFNTAPIVDNKWHKIQISQTLLDGKYIYKVLVNGEQVNIIENTQAQKFAPIKVFAGDDFYAAPEGKIRNLSIYTRHE